jgi:hypothetical protein
MALAVLAGRIGRFGHRPAGLKPRPAGPLDWAAGVAWRGCLAVLFYTSAAMPGVW